MKHALVICALALAACKSEAPRPTAPSPALPRVPDAEPPRADVEQLALLPQAAPPAEIADPKDPAVLLHRRLVSVPDAAAFRGLMADRLRLVALDKKGRPGKATTVDGAHLDALFAAQIRPLLPHEPSPMDGDGEDLTCDGAQRSCVFQDAEGRATTYLFDDGARLKEIRYPRK